MGSRRTIFISLALSAIVGGVAGWRVIAARRIDQALELGIREARIGRSQKAAELLDLVLRVRPGQPQALLYRGQLARDAGDVSMALSLLRRVPDSSPIEAAAARFIEGAIRLENHEARPAEELFRRSISLNPLYVQPRERLASLYRFQARGQLLRETLDGIRRLRSLTLQELIAYGDPAGFVFDAAEHVPILEAFVSADAEDIESMIALVRYRIATDRLDLAEDRLKVARSLWPSDDRIKALAGEVMLARGQLKDARGLLATATESDLHAEVLRIRGFVEFAAERWSDAVNFLEGAWIAAPDDLATAYKLGQAWGRAGRHEPSRRLLEQTRLMERASLIVHRIRMGNQQRPDLLAPIVLEAAEDMSKVGRFVEAQDWIAFGRNLQPSNAEFDRLVSTLDELKSHCDETSDEIRKLVEFARLDRRREAASIAGQTATGRRQDGPPLVAGGEHVPIRLTDVAAESGLDFAYFTGQSEFKFLIETLGGGVATFDYDGDGWPDLYFTQGQSVPGQPIDVSRRDRLYRNRGDGTFADVTDAAGLGDTNYSQGCTAGDYDNDGDLDLFVANFGRNVVYRSNGDGTFTDVTDEVGIGGERWSSSLALADLDLDGDLDLYVATYVLAPLKICRTPTGKISTCSPGNFVAEDDVLYLNDGAGGFLDASKDSGILAPNGKGLGIVIADFDDDRLPDIYVSNDGTPNFLFHNVGKGAGGGPKFEEIGLTAGCAVAADGASRAGMGIAAGDFDNDGRMDMYVTNFYFECNTMYVNDGGMLFHDATLATGLFEATRSLLGFGTQAIDFDLDGQLDLIVTNGHIDDFSSRNEPWKMPPRLYRNQGGLRFKDASLEAGTFFGGAWLGRGLSRLDWNRDGKPEAVIVHQDRPVALLRNDTEGAGHFLALELRGVDANRDAIGVRYRYRCQGITRGGQLTGGDGYFAVNDRRQVLGVGDATQVDELEIEWPGGRQQSWKDLPVDRTLLVVEGRQPLPLGP